MTYKEIVTQYIICDNCQGKVKLNGGQFSFMGWRTYRLKSGILDFCGYCAGTRQRQGYANIYGEWKKALTAQEFANRKAIQ